MNKKVNEAIIKPIAYIHTDFKDKFGVPRQSGIINELVGKIVFESEYRRTEAVRGLEDFSHLWIIWQFSENADAGWSPTVRPPRLGGNKRVGVFASRSPFRPNSLGLSSVKIEKIDLECDNAPVIYVSGVDMVDMTPIFDIKPYIPFADCHIEAMGGYTDITRTHSLEVIINDNLCDIIGENNLTAVKKILENDPRPGYDDDDGKEYGVTYANVNIRFKVMGSVLEVISAEKL